MVSAHREYRQTLDAWMPYRDRLLNPEEARVALPQASYYVPLTSDDAQRLRARAQETYQTMLALQLTPDDGEMRDCALEVAVEELCEARFSRSVLLRAWIWKSYRLIDHAVFMGLCEWDDLQGDGRDVGMAAWIARAA